MITIDANLVYNSQYYALNTRRLNKKAYDSIETYPEDYATKDASNTNNATSTNNVSSANHTNSTNNVSSANNTSTTDDINTGDLDLNALLQELKLEMPANRFSVLLQMPREQLINMLFLLEKDKLILGLKYFNKEKLCNFIQELPKEEIIKVISQIYTKEQILEMFPTKALVNFFDNIQLEPGELIKVIKDLPPNILAQVYEAATGEPAGKMNYDQFVNQFQKNIDEQTTLEGFKSLNYKEMTKVINKFVTNNPKQMTTFSQETLSIPAFESVKSKICEGMMALEPERLIQLIGQLPDKLLACVDTLIQPDKLSEQLLKFNKNLLRSFAA